MTSDMFSKLATRYVADPSGEWTARGSFPIRISGSVAYAPPGTEVSQADRIEVGGKVYDVVGVLSTFGLSACRFTVSERQCHETHPRVGDTVRILGTGGGIAVIAWKPGGFRDA